MSEMKTARQIEELAQRCEVCESRFPVGEYPTGCEQCGRLFGACCNSQEASICVECVE